MSVLVVNVDVKFSILLYIKCLQVYIYMDPQKQRCRSVFNFGEYNSTFLTIFRDFKILGAYSGFLFANFSNFSDFLNLGILSIFYWKN